MGFLKRIGLFLLTNIAVIFLFSIVLVIIEQVFGINIRGASGQSYAGLLIYAAIFGFIGSFFSLAISRWSAKRAYNIRPFNDEDILHLTGKEKLVYDTVLRISQDNGIKTPEVGVYESVDPNAFATGPSKNKSLVAVSSGLLDSMGANEIEGVVAHEMAHILNGDMVTMTLLQGVMNTFVIFFARIIAEIVNNFTDNKLGVLGYNTVYIILQLILGLFASLVIMAFSRWREYGADAGGARFAGRDKMLGALESLKSMKHLAPKDQDKMATMKINTQTTHGLKMLFMSHPPLEKRIAKLQEVF